jgi:hypothetical protein
VPTDRGREKKYGLLDEEQDIPRIDWPRAESGIGTMAGWVNRGIETSSQGIGPPPRITRTVSVMPSHSGGTPANEVPHNSPSQATICT